MQARLPRDRAPAFRPSRGVTVWQNSQKMPRRYQEWPGLFRFAKVAEYGGAWRMGASWSVLARVCKLRRKNPSNTHASTPPPYSTTLSNRNKPGHFQHPRGVLRALRHSVGPVGDQAAAAQSRRNLAIQYLAISRDSEIVSRLCRCILVTYRSD